MKKILLIVAVAAIGMVSCKKEEPAQPVKVEKASEVAGGVRNDMSGWD